MSFGSRLLRALRANVGHAVRRLGRDDAEDELPDLDPEDFEPRPPPGRSERRRPSASAALKKREELQKAYRALELEWGASPEAIKQAHRRLMRQFHPDRFANEPERLADATRLSQELSIARDALLDAHEAGLI